MAYIIVVNPAILSFAGIPAGRSTVATILAAAFGSLAMGLYANRPIAVTAALGYPLGFGEAPKALAALPFTGAYDLGVIALKLDIAGALRLSFLPILLTLFLMGFLDTLGTLVGVGAAGG